MHAWQGPDPPKCLLCPTTQFAKDQDTLIEQSNILLKQSVNIICYVNNIYSHSCIVTLSLTQKNKKGIIGGTMGIKKNNG